MGLRRELKVLQKKWEKGCGEFQDKMELFIVNEGRCREDVCRVISGHIEQARRDGDCGFILCYKDFSLVQTEELLIIEEWLEAQGYEFDLEEVWEDGKKTVNLAINLS